MNILLVAYYHDQPGSGGRERARALSSRFRAAGHRVFVVTAGYTGDRREEMKAIVHDPGHNGDRRGVNYLPWLARRLAVEASLRSGRYASIFGAWLRRAERDTEAILAAAAPDVILASYPPAEDLELGLFLHEKSGTPLVAEFRDGLAFEPVERRAMGFAAVRREYGRLERAIARQAAAIVTVSPPLSRHFEQAHGCRTVRTIPNGYDPLPPLQPLEPDPFSPECFHVVHTGGIAMSDRASDLSPWTAGVAGALADFPDLGQRLRLHFAGRLSRRERQLLRPLAAAGLARLYGPLPRETALWMQRQAQLLLLIAPADRASVATAKLFEYMQADRPVLALAAGTFAADIVADTGIGWVIPADSPAEVRAALVAIMKGELPPPARDEQQISRFDQRAHCAAYLSLLEELLR